MRFATKILKIIEETHDVKTFRLSRPANLDFIAGQYCLVSLPESHAQAGQSRPFTFSSSPTDRHSIDLTVKRMGDFTSEMFALLPGQALEIDGPKGEQMNFDSSVQDKVVFVAGGSGITPFMSALRYADGEDLKNDMILLFANRASRDMIFRKELEDISSRHRNIRVINTITAVEPGWKGEVGRVDRRMIEKYVPMPDVWLWYICGPPGMVLTVKTILAELGVSEKNLRIEPWQIPGKSG
jgi:ferredoxin-NADP reductase